MLDFGRDICGDLAAATRREWLVTNGIGGYASGTIAGVLTRRYHGLLLAALKPPLGRTLLAAKLDETVTYAGQVYPLHANRRVNGEVTPDGFRHLERFRLEGTTPVWTFACADALLEKRVWMQPGANTTYIWYQLCRGSAPLALSLAVLVNHRDHHALTRAGDVRLQATSVTRGLQVTAGEGAAPFWVLSDRAEVELAHEWQRDFFLSVEEARGLDTTEDHLHAGDFHALLRPGEALTVVASAEPFDCAQDKPAPNLDGVAAYAARQAHEARLLATCGYNDAPEPLRRLVLAADQFIVRRDLEDPSTEFTLSAVEGLRTSQTVGHSVIAGYHWFGDWGRDTMIALPGLTLTTGRPEVARSILRTFARYVSQGMLPNRFPDAGEAAEYNTLDATLWYFEAIRAYHAAAGDDDLLAELFPALQEIVAWHQRGTRYNIHVDPQDGLVYGGQEGVQLTWMDAKVEDWVVTPRIGKPVEINALWYNALCVLADFACRLGRPDAAYRALAERARAAFARFWNAEAGYCYDVLDGPAGDDAALRPNQLFAAALPHSPLTAEQQRQVVDACARHLLTSHGLRSLAPDDPAYVGRYGGDRRWRDGAYHQGTVWGWLIGPFISAHLRVYRDPQLARSYLLPLIRHLADHGLGSISEIFDGDPPFTPEGCIAQAWSVAEVLRALELVERYDQATGG